MQIIVKQSKHRKSHITLSKNRKLIEKVSGRAGIDTERKIEIATFVLLLTNEIKRHTFINNIYTSLDTAPIFVRFLNLYDTDAVAFEPLLKKLKAYSGEELTPLILPELESVHAQWLKISKNADKYQNLILNYVDPDEVAALKRMVDSGIFYSLMDDITGFKRLLFNPATWHTNVFSPTFCSCHSRETFHERLIDKYEHCLDFIIDVKDSKPCCKLLIISKDDRYYLIGQNEHDKFTFEELTAEYPINGYPFDFSGLKDDSDKCDNLRVMIEMALSHTSLLHQTRNMTPNESMIFALELLISFLDTDLYNTDYNSTSGFNRQFLMELGNGVKYECSSMVDFSEKAKEHIISVVNGLYDSQLEGEKLEKLISEMKSNKE